MAKDNPEWSDPWEENPYFTGNFTGRKGNEGQAVWNPETNQIEKYTKEEWLDKSRDYRRETGENLISPYYNKYGEFVYGYRPENTYSGMVNGEQVSYSGRDPFEDNRQTIPDPNNNTPVPRSIPNPDYDPDKVIDQFQPKPEGGPEIYYPTTDMYEGGRVGGRRDDRGSGGNWNWEAFEKPNFGGGGGYDPEQYAFDRYVPGMDSPWGVPEVSGGNTDFYRNQMLNLLRDEQGFRERQRTAAEAQQSAEANPLESAPIDWSWVQNPDGSSGLPDPFRNPYGVSAEYLNSPGFGYQVVPTTEGES